MTKKVLQKDGRSQLDILPKMKRVGASFGRLALTGLVTFGIGTYAVYERYQVYWNKTIFRTQTVDFNILAHTLPTKLSHAIINNQYEEVQRTLDSNYSLFGLIVTDPSGQRIVTSSGATSSRPQSWSAALNPQELQKYPYDLLLDPPPLFPQWNYQDPHATESSATNFTNRGRVIGRVYYARGIPPSFQSDFLKWLSNPLSRSSRIESYTTTMFAFLVSGWAFWILWEYLLYRKRIQELEAEEKEKVLVQQNKTLELQLTERINQLNSLQEQWEQERYESTIQAQRLHSHNQQLQVQIAQLQASIVALPAAVNSTAAQEEIDKAKADVDLARFYQQQQEAQIKQLNYELRVYQSQLTEAKSQGEELKELQAHIQKTKNALSIAEVEKENLQANEQQHRATVTRLEEQLAQQRNIQEQLNNQLKILEQSLAESRRQEQESALKAQRASEQMQILAEELGTIKEDMGQHPLNKFEQAILTSLQTALPHVKVRPQFDAGTQGSNSKFIDFVVITNSCFIAIEAKSYKGVIKPVGDARNTNWVCKTNNREVLINACWGLNPYQQVNTYVNSLLSRSNKSKQKIPVHGVVVFPSEAKVSTDIQSNIAGFYRVTTLNELVETIRSIESTAPKKNATSSETLERILTGVPVSSAA